MEKKKYRFLQNQQYTFYGEKKEKISLIYHRIISLAFPVKEIQIVQYSKPLNFKSCSIMFPLFSGANLYCFIHVSIHSAN